MALRSILVLGAAGVVGLAMYGCSDNAVSGPTEPVVDASIDRSIPKNDSGGGGVCPNTEVPGADITRATATLTFRTPSVGRCSPTEISAFRNLPATATLTDLLAALASDTCRQCALSDVEDDLWGLLIFKNTGGMDGGANRTYNAFVRPNDVSLCFANFGVQGCGRYVLRRSLCADNTCDDACPTDTAYNNCLDDVFAAGGACTATERALAWDTECPVADFNRANAACRNLSTADILNYVCGSGTTDAGSSDSGGGG